MDYKILNSFSTYFPKSNIIKIGYLEDYQRYGTMALTVSISIFIICALLLEIILAFVIFCIFFLIITKVPQIEYNKNQARIEAEFPFMLRTLGTLLNVNISFKKAFQILSKSEGSLGDEMKTVNQEVDNGASVPKALSNMAQRIRSNDIKTAISQMITAYDVGGKGNEIRRISQEMAIKQRHNLKEYASISSVFGLLFIVSSTLLPTFFVVLSSLGGQILETEITEMHAKLIIIIVIPLISFIVLQLMKLNEPLQISERKKSGKEFILLMVPIAGFLFFQEIGFIILIFTFLVSGAIFYKLYRKETRIEMIEKNLPNALMAAATLPENSKLEDIFRIFKKGDYEELSKEAEISLRQLESKIGDKKVLQDFSKRNDGHLIERTVQTIDYSLESGNTKRINETAEDLLEFNGLVKERESLLSVQKYTLLFGVVILPLILNSVISILQKMSSITKGNPEVLNSINGVIPAYILIYAIFISYYIAEISKKRSTMFIYFNVLSIIGLVSFYFGKIL